MPSRGTPSSAGPWINFVATFYNNDEASTGKQPGHPAYGITASGRPTTQGVTIAVDPRVIPLGSIVEIEYPDGKKEYRRADDTGRLIKGYKIDIFSNQPDSVLYGMGKQHIKLRILKRGA